MNAITRNIQKDVKNKKLSMLMLLTALLLVGCGKKIIECGDPAVESILKSTISANLTKNPPEMDAMVSQMSESLNAPYQMLAPVTKSNFTETSSEPGILGNIKLDAFSSTKKDKDSGMNYCTAMVSGDSIHRYKINTTDSFTNGAGKELLLELKTDANSIFTEGANALNKTPTKDIKIKDIKSLEAKVGTNSLELKFVTSLPTNIAYTANMTDKGDQIIVNLTNSGVQLNNHIDNKSGDSNQSLYDEYHSIICKIKTKNVTASDVARQMEINEEFKKLASNIEHNIKLIRAMDLETCK